MSYKGEYQVQNRQKYRGNPANLKFRSSWELSMCRWCDTNPKVVRWNFESVHIPYHCSYKNTTRKYIMDFWIKFDTGQEYLVEIKPEKQTKEPVKPKRLTTKSKQNYLYESYLWHNNKQKWRAAVKFAEKRNMKFVVMHEDKLKKLGIKIYGKQKGHNRTISRRKKS